MTDVTVADLAEIGIGIYLTATVGTGVTMQRCSARGTVLSFSFIDSATTVTGHANSLKGLILNLCSRL